MFRATAAGMTATLLVGCRTAAPDPTPEPAGAAALPAEPDVYLEAVVAVKPEVLRMDPPIYPDSLRMTGIQGRVVLEFIIDRRGHVEPRSFSVVESPHPGLSDAALRAMRTAVFTPAEIRGRPVRVLVRVPLDFRLRRPLEEP